MARSIYRLYLYVVAIGALANAAFWIGHLLFELFLPASQRACVNPCGSDDPLGQAVGAGALACVALVGLGWLHRRWIWGDIADEPNASTGLIRTIALNLAQGVVAVAGLAAGVYALYHLDQWSAVWQPGAQAMSGADHALLAASFATVPVALGAFLVLQTERALTPVPSSHQARTAQRVHLYLIQAIVLIAAFVTSRYAIEDLIPPSLGGGTPSSVVTITGHWLGALYVVGVGAVYLWLARGDAQSTIRLVIQLLGFTAGLIALVLGIWGVATVLGGKQDVPLAPPQQAVPLLVLGVAFTAGFGVWLVSEAPRNRLGRELTVLTMMAIAALVLGVAFYESLILLGVDVLRFWGINSGAWISALGLLVPGLAHPPLAWWLRIRVREAPAAHHVPRQAFMMVGLAAGVLTVASAFVALEFSPGSLSIDPHWWSRVQADLQKLWTDLNALCTGACLQSPGVHPDLIAVIVLVGLFVAVLYGFVARAEGWLPHMGRARKREREQGREGDAAASEDARP